MPKVGAPTKFKKEYVFMVEKMATLGLTDLQMAEVLGVAVSTFSLWKTKHPEFSEANARGKVDPNRQVEQSLFRMALGGYTTKRIIRDADGAIVKTIEEERAGDVTAATKWLFNRDPERWKDKQEIGLSGELGLNFTNLTPEEFEKRKAELLAKVGKK